MMPVFYKLGSEYINVFHIISIENGCSDSTTIYTVDGREHTVHKPIKEVFDDIKELNGIYRN